jgi:hypothetical protein
MGEFIGFLFTILEYTIMFGAPIMLILLGRMYIGNWIEDKAMFFLLIYGIISSICGILWGILTIYSYFIW